MDKKNAEKYFSEKFPSRDNVNNGVIREIKEEIERAEKISDTRERYRTTNSSLSKHESILNSLESYFNLYLREMGYSRTPLDKYKEQVDKLKKIEKETVDKLDETTNQNRKNNYQLKTSYCAYCKSKPPANHYIYSEKNKLLKPRKRNANPYKKEYLFCSEVHFEKWHKKNYFVCGECLEEKWDGKYERNKKDNQKFCSKKCFNNHYAETCDKCHQKALGDTYYSDPQNKTGTLCSKCNKAEIEKDEREIARIRKELNQPYSSENNQEEPEENERKGYCRFCNDECSSIFNVCEKMECLLKHDEEYAKKHNIPFDKRERERERAKSHSANQSPHWNHEFRTNS